jgi:glycosyltransferase involved in cell wall biosynthesis
VTAQNRIPTSATGAPLLSLVIPAYNEASRIGATLEEAVAALDALRISWELLVIDDGSSDATRTIAEAFARHHPDVRVEALPHRGKAAAVSHGMRVASGDLILFSDADLATPLSYMPIFIERSRAGYDVVIASREGITATRIGEPAYRHFMGRVFNWLVQLLLLPGIEDSQCGFKLFSRDVAHQLIARTLLYRDLESEVSGARVTAFDVELLVIARRLGYRIESIPVEWTYGTQSKVNPLRDSLYNARDLLLIKWNDLRGRYKR